MASTHTKGKRRVVARPLFTDNMGTMKPKTKNIIRGIGSVMDVCPRSYYYRFIPKQTPAERMQSHWESVGNSLWRVVRQFRSEEETRKQAS